MPSSESDTNSVYGVERYRHICAADTQPRQKPANAEDVAFQTWVASQNHETLSSSSDSGAADRKPSAFVELDISAKSSVIINSPRQYQLDLFERAKEENTIVVLDTGSGKTLIAALLLRHTLDGELQRRADGKAYKTAFFLVDKVVLCLQQYNVLSANLNYPIGKVYGNTVSGLKTKEDWDAQIRENMAIVCTAQILLDLLGSGLISMSQINLLIFDEAHHTKKSHPYAKIVRNHYLRMKTERPRILGMTASPVDSKTQDLKVATLELEATLCSKIATISDEALDKENQKRQQLERVCYYAPILHPEKARTDLWQSLSAILGLVSDFDSHLEATQDASSVLGPWCADQYWNILFSPCQVPQSSTVMRRIGRLDHADERLLKVLVNEEWHSGPEEDHTATAVAKASQTTLDYMKQRQNATINAVDFSSKFLALHDILHGAYSRGQTKRCIVFVQKRYIAFLLSHVFARLEVRIPGMVCSYMVGSQKVSSSITNMSVREQSQIMRQFQKGEINCLFATQVAEEGIDVPDCDLIIRFDLHDSAIQYIQSRGRARQAKSTFVHMVEEGNTKQKRRLLEASRDATALRRFVSALSADRKVADLPQPIDDNERQGMLQRVFHIPETGAQLSFDSSPQVLARFVSSLSSSAEVHPEYVITPTYAGGLFVATVLLPESSPVKMFRGMPQRSKTLARGSAAFEACIDMINRKFINGHLQPTLSKRLPLMRNARLALSSQKRAEYNMKIKSDRWLQTGTPTELFAVLVALDDAILPGKHGRSLCLLTRFGLPQITPMELFVKRAEKTTAVLLPCGATLKISDTDLAILAKFTMTMFKDVFSKEYDCTASELPYFIAPCVSVHDTTTNALDPRSIVDWPLLDAVSATGMNMTLGDGSHADSFENKFVTDPVDGSRKFFTKTVNTALKPFDSVPAGVPKPKSRSYVRVTQNIAEYSNSLSLPTRRRMEWNARQPVFDAELLPLRRNYLCPPSGDDSETCQNCFIILEPLSVSQLPVDVVITALVIPVIMYRIDSILISVDACRSLHLEIEPMLALEAFTKDSSNTDEHGQQQTDFQPGMGNNYERLEFLGDAFLKTATTIAVFTQIPNSTEFEYHVERMLLICNKNLFNHAVDRKLEEYIRSKAFDRRTWYPDLKLTKGKAPKTRVVHSLADKSIADVCEAVIGAAYMSEPHGTMDLAVKAVTKMVRSRNHTMTQFSDYYKQYVLPAWQSAAPSATERFAAKEVHARIGYGFNSPKLLRSATKHPSYPYEPDIPHYQCLEFLGDALLDLTAVDYLFFTFPEADPQWLTEHKMAMVSNHFFACLCVELGLHRHLLTTNSSMLGNIAQFARQLEEAKIESCSSSHEGTSTNGQPSPSFWVSLTQPPKALSDVLEAVVGAMFVDSGYNYQVVQDFFDQFIRPYFEDMAPYDTYAAGNAVTVLTKLMQDVFQCRSWRLCVAAVPCGSETGAAALTEENVVCAMMVHGKAVDSQIRGNGREAKIGVAARVLRQVQGMDRDTFRGRMGCDCA
ncbi:hypothetical protein E4U43_007513 [Claviceps pusilla]|uniref:Dicer-like protein 1 n=1 Tax=Claviceps pusilla TaxID=123648 RepID=A0A9P7T1L0_9HYPO|nr:hypothetical protein E4U43_007513 [Claviceps pusilla]